VSTSVALIACFWYSVRSERGGRSCKPTRRRRWFCRMHRYKCRTYF